jgi:hypothetical protein
MTASNARSRAEFRDLNRLGGVVRDRSPRCAGRRADANGTDSARSARELDRLAANCPDLESTMDEPSLLLSMPLFGPDSSSRPSQYRPTSISARRFAVVVLVVFDSRITWGRQNFGLYSIIRNARGSRESSSVLRALASACSVLFLCPCSGLPGGFRVLCPGHTSNLVLLESMYLRCILE